MITYSASGDQHAPAGGVHWDNVVARTYPLERDFGVDIICAMLQLLECGMGYNLTNLIDDFDNDVELWMGWLMQRLVNHSGGALKLTAESSLQGNSSSNNREMGKP